MAHSTSFTCATCGERHADTRNFFYDSPYQYKQLSAEDRAESFLNSDICHIRPDDYFVRGCLDIPVHGQDEPYTLGLWVSLSKANFDRYLKHGDESPDEGPYFGWLCNKVPGYAAETLNLKTSVYFRTGGIRPLIVVNPGEHPLAEDQRNGISPEALERLLEASWHRD
jgi:hypothetical protein